MAQGATAILPNHEDIVFYAKLQIEEEIRSRLHWARKLNAEVQPDMDRVRQGAPCRKYWPHNMDQQHQAVLEDINSLRQALADAEQKCAAEVCKQKMALIQKVQACQGAIGMAV